jgi:hypothetical protein
MRNNLIEGMTNILNRDSFKHNHQGIDYIFIEVDHPMLVDSAISTKAKKQFLFGKNRGLWLLTLSISNRVLATEKNQ